MSFLVSKPERIRTNEASSESIASFSKQEIMSSFLPEGGCYELLTIIGKGFEDLMTVNLTRYKPTGEYVTVRRINLEACSNEMVTFLQGELHVSKLFSHPNILPYRATFIADNELWVVTPFMAYGSAKDLICTHFMDGMNELAIAYILQGVLKALDYIHHMGYVHRSVKASHILISMDGKVYLSGLRSNLSMISHGALPAGHQHHPHRTFSPHFHHFVEQCLQRNPDVRPSASTLLSHSFFKQIKRRASEALPELLRPVTPITNFEGSQSQGHSGIFGLVTNLEELEVDDWEF